jgi:tetratricopeptide (TPR) repeat protein
MMLLAQGQFASGQYNAATGTTKAAMRLLPDDRWAVVVANRRELYAQPREYLDQLLALDKAAKQNPSDAALRFLAGFHYACLGYPKAAIDNLDKALNLAPQDTLARRLRDDMQARLATSALPTTTPPAATEVPRPAASK